MRKYRFSSMVLLIIALLFCISGVAAANFRDIIFLIDNSAHMKKGDPGHILKKTIAKFVKELSDDTQVGVLIFDHNINLAAPLTVVSENNRQTILASLDEIDYRGKLTNIPDAMKGAIFAMAEKGQKKSHRVVIFITGGKVDTGDKGRDIEKTKWLLEKLPKGAAKHGIKVFGVAFTDQADIEFIQTLVEKTEGEYFKAATANEIPIVFSRIYKRIMGIGTESEKPMFTVADNDRQITSHQSDNNEYSTQQRPLETRPGTQIDPSPIYIAEKPPAQAPVHIKSDEPEASSPPVKHVMKKPGDLKATTKTSSRARKLPLPLPIMVLIVVVLAISVVVILNRSKRQKARVPVIKPTNPPKPPPQQKQPVGTTPTEFIPEALFRDVSGITGEDTHKIIEKNTKIGRKKKLNQIVINEDTISRQHAVIEYKNYGFWISDQNSSNGTFLNGKKIVDEMKLSNGDTVSFDVYDFEFILPGIKFANTDVDKTTFRKFHDTEG